MANVTSAQKKATATYERKNYFKTLVRFKKCDEEKIRQMAGDNLNGFIVSAVMEKVNNVNAGNSNNANNDDNSKDDDINSTVPFE